LQDKLDRAQLAETTVSAWQVAHRPRAVNADATGVLLVAHARALAAATWHRAEIARGKKNPDPAASPRSPTICAVPSPSA